MVCKSLIGHSRAMGVQSCTYFRGREDAFKEAPTMDMIHPTGSRLSATERIFVMAKLRHIAMQVPDLEKAAKFYETCFEMKRVDKVSAPIGDA
ncbi:MAG: VOC family protein, partial [Bradyrhizobium sp.]